MTSLRHHHRDLMPVPAIPDTLTGVGVVDPEGVRWATVLGPGKVTLALMRGKSIIASASQNIERGRPLDLRLRRQITSKIMAMRDEIWEWVEYAGELHATLGVEVRLEQME